MRAASRACSGQPTLRATAHGGSETNIPLGSLAARDDREVAHPRPSAAAPSVVRTRNSRRSMSCVTVLDGRGGETGGAYGGRLTVASDVGSHMRVLNDLAR